MPLTLNPDQNNSFKGNPVDYTDRPAVVRDGEMPDQHRVETFLRDNIPGLKGKMTLQQFPCGASNLTYLAIFDNRELVLRRPPIGTKAKTAHDVGREYIIISALYKHFPYLPQPFVFTKDESIMGCPFLVMERLKGIILRKDMPLGILESPREIRTLHENFVRIMHQLHTLDYHKLGLADLGRPDGYIRRQVLGWNKRFRASRTPDVPDFEEVMAWLEEKMPREAFNAGIIHNDFKLDNIILDPQNPTRIIGILDWEMSTLGDPMMDVGSTLGYWVEKNDPAEMQMFRTMPTDVDGALTRKEFLEVYGRVSGFRMPNFDFYYGFGLFRLAVIYQQIYYRYFHGQTKDARFQKAAPIIAVLERTVRRVISQSSL